MTQKQLADLLCVSKSTVAHWEQGISQPKPDIEMLIVRHFGVTLDYLNGDSTFSRFENVMNTEFVNGTTYMVLFDQILVLPEEYHAALKLQLDSFHAREREKQRGMKK